MDRLAWAASQVPRLGHTVVDGNDLRLHPDSARKVVYAVLAELVQATDELEEDRLQPMTTQETLQQPTLGQLIEAFGGGDPADRARMDPGFVRSGLIRVLEQMAGEPRAVQMTIFGKAGWRETALQALLEEAAEPPTSNALDTVRQALRVLARHAGGEIEAADAAARAISQLAKEHADDAYRTHLSVGHVAVVRQ